MNSFVKWYIIFVCALLLFALIFGAVLFYKGASVASDQDWSGGVKPVIERLWCGNPGCSSN